MVQMRLAKLRLDSAQGDCPKGHRNMTLSFNFFTCKISIPYDASYVYDACNVLVKSYSKSIIATTYGIVLVTSSPDVTGQGQVALSMDGDMAAKRTRKEHHLKVCETSLLCRPQRTCT